MGKRHACMALIKATLLYTSIYLLALASGEIRGYVPSLSADQFDYKNPKELKYIANLFNCLLLSSTPGASIGVTFIIYISTVKMEWDKGFIISMSYAAAGLIFITLGKPFYRVREPGNSPLLIVLEVFVVAVKNWKVKIPENEYELYQFKNCQEKPIPHTKQFRFLDKELSFEKEETQ